MQTLKFSRFYSYSEALSMSNLAKGKGIYVWGIYSEQCGIIPYYVGESGEGHGSIINRINDHINRHMETYRIYNLNKFITKKNADKKLYEILYNIVWKISKSEKYAVTQSGFYNTLTNYQIDLFKKYTLYENNEEYIQFKYGVTNFKKNDTQRQLIAQYPNNSNRRNILEDFTNNWKIYFTRFRFSYCEIDENTEVLEMNVHNALDQSTDSFKKMLINKYSLNFLHDRTMFLGKIKKYSHIPSKFDTKNMDTANMLNGLKEKKEFTFKIDLNEWKNIEYQEQVTGVIVLNIDNCIYL